MKADGSGQGSLFGSELAGLTLQYTFSGERAIDWAWQRSRRLFALRPHL